MIKDFRLLIGAFVFVGLYCLGETYASDQDITPDAINEKLENNDLLKKLGKNGPLNDHERQRIVEQIPGYCNSSGGGIVNRNIADFKGDTLLVGGGKKFGLSGPKKEFIGVTNIEKLLKDIEDLKNERMNFVEGKNGEAVKLDEGTRKLEIEKTQKKIDAVLDQYYTVNYDKSMEPDLVASITNVNELSTLPNNRFKTVVFENVDNQIWFCPSIFKILERIVKPGGKIVIQGAVQPRLLVIAFAPTKWANEVNPQFEKAILSNDYSIVTFTN